jgi:hypothetical protein
MSKNNKLIVLFFILAAVVFLIPGSRQAVSETVTQSNQLFESETLQPQQIDPGQAANRTRAEQVIRALAEAYPRQIERVEFRNGDWALLLHNTWYYYADGKLLPENLLGSAASYSPQPFYNYPAELPPWRIPSAEESARIRDMANNRNRNPPRRSPHFFDDLWRVHNRAESYDRVKTINFLGKSAMVHYLILESLSIVEEQIIAAAANDPQVMAWKNSVNSLEGWNWRNIAETQSRSYHSYGLAIDLLPRSLGGKETYWLWASNRRADWWNISYNDRFHPPHTVIKIFETYGFIWGGKWLYFDTMHFEYRPEILILSGMPPETRR